MDTVRFGRVLGSGARSAAKTLIQAIDAAKADNPARAPAGPSLPAEPRRSHPSDAQWQDHPAAAAAPLPSARLGAKHGPQQPGGIRHGASRFRDLALKPFVRLSGVLVLEIAGVFFGVFALYGFNTMWRAHTSWHAGSPNHRQFVGGALMLALFGYFCISSFVRARRRERGH